MSMNVTLPAVALTTLHLRCSSSASRNSKYSPWCRAKPCRFRRTATQLFPPGLS